ncbi:MAG: hypothetical protein ISR59_12325 [Anaerolineales bacterium]|uniref:Uncharacterized protein n=1 Tax=Candidatus Desulfolinea nitratireducens TaxID=2841698 RepID=A0A8J6NKD1_9CHLR|nr:hypothetical protein [Candidatus Desulfolinea nitratireducens]MBL6961884.1 hypothetical protein [Anaerolineales bacterium]
MTIEIDDKGKFFTDIITKIPTPVLVQTTTHLINGTVHVRKDARLKDELNQDIDFLALTEADVLNPEGKVLYHTEFIAVQKKQIVWVMPDINSKEEENLS